MIAFQKLCIQSDRTYRKRIQADLANIEMDDTQEDIKIKQELICLPDIDRLNTAEELIEDIKTDIGDDRYQRNYSNDDIQDASAGKRSAWPPQPLSRETPEPMRLPSIRIHAIDDIPEKSSYQCEMCGEVFFCKKRILIHLHKHLGNNRFACTKCDASFAAQRILRAHRAREHSDGAALRFSCDKPGCSKSYKSKNGLSAHVRSVHLGQRPQTAFICDKCGISKKSAYCLQQHIYQHMQPNYWPFACDSCGKRCRSKYALGVHQKRIHWKIWNLLCSECSAGFMTNQELSQHMVRHHNLEPSQSEYI